MALHEACPAGFIVQLWQGRTFVQIPQGKLAEVTSFSVQLFLRTPRPDHGKHRRVRQQIQAALAQLTPDRMGCRDARQIGTSHGAHVVRHVVPREEEALLPGRLPGQAGGSATLGKTVPKW